MCDYKYPNDLTNAEGRVWPNYCQRASQFWVQSLLSSHNSLACPHHLARIVREIDEAARQFDITNPNRKPNAQYRKFGTHPDDDGSRMTSADSNYARVTVKPYTRNGN